MGYAGGILDKLGGIGLAAPLAVVAQIGPVQLIHRFTPGHGVQAVHVLGDDRQQLTFFFPLGQLVMGRVGPGVHRHELVPIELKEFLGMVFIKGVAQHGFRGIFELHAVQAVLAAEVFDSAFR